MKKLRWGVIGAGGIADRRTIPGMMLAKNAELIAVMDINAEQVEKIRQKYGAKRGYTKEEDLLADPEVDAVYIATPIVLHAKQAKLAADYGKDILIEKPLAMTSDEGQEVIEYCESKGVKIAAGFMMRFGSHVMSMKKVIAEGKIGTVVSGYSQFTLWLPYEPGNWRQCKAKAGGGAMMDLSVHTIDLMEYITGMRVTEVASMNEKIAFPEPQYDVEDTSTILMRMENGAQCVVQSNFNIPDEASKWRVEFFGTKGRLLGDTMIGQIDGGKLNAVFIDKNVAYSAEQTHADDAGIEIPGDFGNMYTREIESFSDSILNGKPLVVPASDAVHVQLLGIIYCAIYIVIARFGTQYLVLLFMNADEAQSVLDYTQRMSYAYAYGTPLLLGVNVFRLSIQGMGYSRLSLISGLLEMIARTAVGIWGVPQFGFAAACLASPLAWALADCFLIPAYYGCLNARRRQAARVRKELPTE